MTGKFLAYILRHNPASCGIELDENVSAEYIVFNVKL